MPKLSVVMPSHNHGEFIAEAISSILAQSFADLELIIVDDGSTDFSADEIRRFDDKRIVTHFQENRAAHSALNKCK